jgi:hypothetical protein
MNSFKDFINQNDIRFCLIPFILHITLVVTLSHDSVQLTYALYLLGCHGINSRCRGGGITVTATDHDLAA